ncbi:zinc finger protein 90 [Ctenopharyngodon idella]|uniref:zinc finger protein 90 n=1 Tax=Ctenopharyngodon idella TaxID=7959 RepID=UPI002231F0A7|nr:zinc finger protein 90 [Ctenopharyngodon idella]
MSQMDLLITNVAELLTAAVQEVLQLMGQAMLEYQKESARTRLENQNLQQKLKELQERMAGASDEVLKVSFARDELHLREDHVQEDLVHRGDSVVSEEIPSDNPVHLKLVLDDISVGNQHHFLQGTCDYSLTMQRPLSMNKSSPPRRIPNASPGSRESPVTSNTETPLGSNKIKVESKPELLECSITEETGNAATQAPVVPMQDANEHNQQPASTFSNNVVHYNQPCKLLNSTSKQILRSRVENTGDVHSAPSMSESREFLHSCHVCGKTFATPSSLGAHFVCHSNERPFVCKCCKFRFSRLADLKKHERIHTGERPYNCSLCGRRFNRTENLKRHLRKVHYGAAL